MSIDSVAKSKNLFKIIRQILKLNLDFIERLNNLLKKTRKMNVNSNPKSNDLLKRIKSKLNTLRKSKILIKSTNTLMIKKLIQITNKYRSK
jgi:hypothetical protein